MKIVNFVKEAGKSFVARLGGREVIDREGIIQSISDHGFEIKNLDLRIDDAVATLAGTARTQAEREKVVVLVGNTRGIARVNDQLDVMQSRVGQAQVVEATYYNVRPGDSLSRIANQEYGDAMQYAAIFEANKPMLKDPNLIYPGQVLRIPPIKRLRP